MITELVVHNFQTHQILNVELDRITTFVGPSDVGKSSVIRAVRWACLNIPVSSMIREGQTEVSVGMKVDGEEIIRRRDSSGNSCCLGDQVFKAFRSDVPQRVADHLKLDAINFQNQHDPSYWFTDSAGEVSRKLNAIVDLSIIDRMLASVTTTHNKAKIAYEAAEKSLATFTDQRDHLFWIEDCDEDLCVVEAKGVRLNRLSGEKGLLEAYIGDIETESKSLMEAQRWETDVSCVVVLGEEWFRLMKEASDLREVLQDVTDTERDAAVCIPSLSELHSSVEWFRDIRDARAALKQAVISVDGCMTDLVACKASLRQVEKELKKGMDGRCPLCGNELKD